MLPEKDSSTTFDPALDTPVWGADAIGKVISRSKRQTFYLLERRLIDADRIGSRWRSTRRRLLTPQRATAEAE
jgi:hypothetical protein